MRISITALLITLFHIAFSQEVLVWSDEFNGTSLKLAKFRNNIRWVKTKLRAKILFPQGFLLLLLPYLNRNQIY